MLLLLCFLRCPAVAVDLQFGLRLDGGSALKWSGSEVFLDDGRVHALRTTAGEIRDVWPGPVRGTFGVVTERGIGILIGRDVQLIAQVDPHSIVRTARVETIVVSHPELGADGTVTIMQEWESDGKGRELLRFQGALRDFDVAASGVVFFTLLDGSCWLGGGPARPTQVARPEDDSTPVLRVFVSKDLTDLAILTETRLCVLRSGSKEWACQPFDSARNAVVRNAVSGAVRLEARVGLSDVRRQQ